MAEESDFAQGGIIEQIDPDDMIPVVLSHGWLEVGPGVIKKYGRELLAKMAGVPESRIFERE